MSEFKTLLLFEMLVYCSIYYKSSIILYAFNLYHELYLQNPDVDAQMIK